MQPLVDLAGTVVPLLRDNIDTDAIIPAAYLRSLTTDPGTGLFARWRYRDDGSDDPAFVLNEPRYAGAPMLLAGHNFGCGSSRENAVWALARFGIRCVIARSFSDIFTENCFKNGVLPLVLDDASHARLAALCTRDEPCRAELDVAAGSLRAGADTFHFDLDARKRAMLIEGADEIDVTLRASDAIRGFRARHREARPWLYPAPTTATATAPATATSASASTSTPTVPAGAAHP